MEPLTLMVDFRLSRDLWPLPIEANKCWALLSKYPGYAVSEVVWPAVCGFVFYRKTCSECFGLDSSLPGGRGGRVFCWQHWLTAGSCCKRLNSFMIKGKIWGSYSGVAPVSFGFHIIFFCFAFISVKVVFNGQKNYYLYFCLFVDC